MLVFQSYKTPSRSERFAEKFFKKEEAEEALLKQQESAQRQSRMKELAMGPANMIMQTELAILQMREKPADLNAAVKTIQDCLKIAPQKIENYLLALDTLLELVERAAIRDHREKTSTELKSAIDAIQAVTAQMQTCEITGSESSTALYQMAYISKRFYDHPPADKEGDEHDWILKNVHMGDGWGSLEDFYHNRLQPAVGARALELLAEQTSMEGRMEFLRTAFRVLNEYKGWESRDGEEEVGYASYRTPAYFKEYAKDPFLQTLLGKMEETLRALETAQVMEKTLQKADIEFQALREEVEKFNGQPLEYGAYAGTSTSTDPTDFPQYVVSKLGAMSLDELFAFRIKAPYAKTMEEARAKAENSE